MIATTFTPWLIEDFETKSSTFDNQLCAFINFEDLLCFFGFFWSCRSRSKLNLVPSLLEIEILFFASWTSSSILPVNFGGALHTLGVPQLVNFVLFWESFFWSNVFFFQVFDILIIFLGGLKKWLDSRAVIQFVHKEGREKYILLL